MARVLAEAGVTVLLIDCDLATHGATYFVEPELTNTDSAALSLRAILSGRSHLYRPLVSSAGFHFLPASLAPVEDLASDSLDLSALATWWGQASRAYQAIILDCQAGFSSLTQWAGQVAKRKLIVLEPDAVSASALRVLSIRMSHELGATDTWQLFNKLTEEERSVYEKVSSGTIFPSLPPIPFDWHVRAAFASRTIPGVLSTGSAFGLAVLRLMPTLFPASSSELAQLEAQAVGNWHDEIAGRLSELEQRRSDIMFQKISVDRQQRLLRSHIITAAGLSVGGLMVAAGRFPQFLSTDLILVALGFALAAGATFWSVIARKDILREREQDRAQEAVQELDREMDRFKTLMTTDPRLREYVRQLGSEYAPEGRAARIGETLRREVVQILERLGISCAPQSSGTVGIDIIATVDGKRVAIAIKTGPMEASTISQEARSMKHRMRAARTDYGVIVVPRDQRIPPNLAPPENVFILTPPQLQEGLISNALLGGKRK